MQEYANNVIDALPLMLNDETRESATVTIVSYMNTIVRKAKTEEDLLIFSKVLEQCKEFSSKNNLVGLNKACSKWINDSELKLNQIRGINDQQTMNSDNLKVAQMIQQLLDQNSLIINKTGRINTNDFEIAASELDEIEESLMSVGRQYLTAAQIQKFLDEINNQRKQIRENYEMIEEILESAGSKRRVL